MQRVGLNALPRNVPRNPELLKKWVQTAGAQSIALAAIWNDLID